MREHKLPLDLAIIRPRAESQKTTLWHPECPLLYAERDVITSLADCPFPLETPTFKVLLFGDDAQNRSVKWCIVEYRKKCGHLAQERIQFEEGVKDFEHYGTKFIGASYSINDWERRIEYFRMASGCDVCNLYASLLTAWRKGYSECRTRKAVEELFLTLMNYNYTNWKDFVSLDKFRDELAKIKRG